VDPRFIVDEEKLGRLADLIGKTWPEQIHTAELQNPALIGEIEAARAALLDLLDLGQLA
jgi:succinylarginine dihydrolase